MFLKYQKIEIMKQIFTSLLMFGNTYKFCKWHILTFIDRPFLVKSATRLQIIASRFRYKKLKS